MVCLADPHRASAAANKETRDFMVSLTVNGIARQFEQPLSCEQLLERLDLAGKRVALERNGEIVARSRLRQQMLADGDTLEIVVAVGGG